MKVPGSKMVPHQGVLGSNFGWSGGAMVLGKLPVPGVLLT